MILRSLIVLLSILVFYGILLTDFSGVMKFFLVIAEMIIVGQILVRRYKLPTEMFFILIKSKRGIKMIHNLAKRKKFWNFFADMGSTISYGLLSMILMPKNTSWKSVVPGMAILLFIFIIIAPMALLFIKTVLTGTPIFDKEQIMSVEDSQLIGILMLVAMLLGGFFLMLLSGLIYYGIFVVHQIMQFLLTGADTLSSTPPSGTILLPGVNLPFFEGIIALIIIMVVHEGSHAVLSRLARVPIMSSGIVLFGIIPIGAFVEPDEKKLAKVDRVRQTRVLAAGSTANFITSILLFIPFILLAILLKDGYIGDTGLLYSAARFVYITFGIAFALNFIVATVNLLPLPLFDGYRILDINIPNKHIMKAIMIITLVSFVLNFLPWLFNG